MGTWEAEVLGCFKTQDKDEMKNFLEKPTVNPEWLVKAGGRTWQGQSPHQTGSTAPTSLTSPSLPYGQGQGWVLRPPTPRPQEPQCSPWGRRAVWGSETRRQEPVSYSCIRSCHLAAAPKSSLPGIEFGNQNQKTLYPTALLAASAQRGQDEP